MEEKKSIFVQMQKISFFQEQKWIFEAKIGGRNRGDFGPPRFCDCMTDCMTVCPCRSEISAAGAVLQPLLYMHARALVCFYYPLELKLFWETLFLLFQLNFSYCRQRPGPLQTSPSFRLYGLLRLYYLSVAPKAHGPMCETVLQTPLGQAEGSFVLPYQTSVTKDGTSTSGIRALVLLSGRGLNLSRLPRVVCEQMSVSVSGNINVRKGTLIRQEIGCVSIDPRCMCVQALVL